MALVCNYSALDFAFHRPLAPTHLLLMIRTIASSTLAVSSAGYFVLSRFSRYTQKHCQADMILLALAWISRTIRRQRKSRMIHTTLPPQARPQPTTPQPAYHQT